MYARAGGFDSRDRLDEVDGVVVVFLDAGGDREDVRIEDDVLRCEADSFGEQFVSSLADADFIFYIDGLSLLVERHYDDGCAIPSTKFRAAQEFGFAIFEADRV